MNVLAKLMFTYIRSFLGVGGWGGEGLQLYICYVLWVRGCVRWLNLVEDAIAFCSYTISISYTTCTNYSN